MTNAQLRIIRQRLGWSTAEMARRLKGQPEQINAFESGTETPSSEILNQYHFLNNGVEIESDQIARAPVNERHLNEAGLAQVAKRDVLNDL